MSNQFYDYLIRLNEFERKQRLSNTLAIDLDDFKNRWKKYAEEFQFPYSCLVIDMDNRVFQIRVLNNKNIAFFGDATPSQDEKILKNITMLASGDGSPQSGTNILIAIGILIACLNPNENVEFRKQILEQLGLFKLEFGMKKVAVGNDFNYTINFSKELGLLLSVNRKT